MNIVYRYRVKNLFLVLAFVAFAIQPLNAQQNAVVIGPEIYRANAAGQQNARLLRATGAISPHIRLSIPRLSRAASVTLPDKSLPVGFGRELPLPYRHDLDRRLRWSALPGGGYAATFAVTSPGAAALRLQFVSADSFTGAEFRFFPPDDPDAFLPVANVNTKSFWSPVVTGQSIAVAIYLPAPMIPDAFGFTAPRLSHLTVAPGASDFRDLAHVGAAGSCNIDVACEAGAVPQAVIDSVAKFVFTRSSGGSSLCTGTLLNDADQTSQIPYFITANHCVENQIGAASMVLFWFFQRGLCAGAAPVDVVQQTGGATLLATDIDIDYALLRLNAPPPDGAGLAGWSALPLPENSAVIGIHHPAGDLKKISFGEGTGFAAYLDNIDGADDFIRALWTRGTTQGGSSGSGIWIEEQISGQSVPLLAGVLRGGYASCEQLSEPDYYARFDVFYDEIQAWLDPARALANGNGLVSVTDISQDAPENGLLNISTRGRVGEEGLVAGFIITGTLARRVVLMGENAGGLGNPSITLTDLAGNIIAENDDWQTHESAGEILAALRAPGSVRDAAFALTLQPGSYLLYLHDASL